MKQYLNILQTVMGPKGRSRLDRTGTGTRGIFGHQERFDLSEGFPLVTTKKVFTRGIIEELLWFIRGSTDNNELEALNVKIWDGWALKEDHKVERRLENYERAKLLSEALKITLSDATRRLNACDAAEQGGGEKLLKEAGIPTHVEVTTVPRGSLGPIYGKQWRSWDAADGRKIDQLHEVIEQIKAKPYSRRHIVTAWNPADMPDESISPQENVINGRMALAACHCLFQFHVEDLTTFERVMYHTSQAEGDWAFVRDMLVTSGAGSTLTNYNETWFNDLTSEQQDSIAAELDTLGVPKRRLNCQLYQRSADTFLGVPFNIASYAILTAMIAQVCGMIPGEFIWTGGDVHVYSNHFDQVNEQLTREPHPLPKLWLNPAIRDINDFTIDDIKVLDYSSHGAIKGAVSV